MDTFFGYDEESMDSETSSVASFRMDRTPATPDEDLDVVRTCRVFVTKKVSQCHRFAFILNLFSCTPFFFQVLDF